MTDAMENCENTIQKFVIESPVNLSGTSESQLQVNTTYPRIIAPSSSKVVKSIPTKQLSRICSQYGVNMDLPKLISKKSGIKKYSTNIPKDLLTIKPPSPSVKSVRSQHSMETRVKQRAKNLRPSSASTPSVKTLRIMHVSKKPTKINNSTLSDSSELEHISAKPMVRKYVSKTEVSASSSFMTKVDSESSKKPEKKRRTKAKKDLELFIKNCNWQDLRMLKEECIKIEHVFKRRLTKDPNYKRHNLETLNKILLLVTSASGLKVKFREKVSNFMTQYLSTHSQLLTQLVLIVAETEDQYTCACATKILYQLLVKSNLLEDKSKAAIKNMASFTSNVDTLIESLGYINARFCGEPEYKQSYQDLYTYILNIILAMCKTKLRRKHLQYASDAIIQFIGKLTAICQRHKELATVLLEIIKLICVRKKNCGTLSNRKFFDGLCRCYTLTGKIFTIAMILKKMTRNKVALSDMSENEKIINMILEFVNYSGKRSINKRSLMSTLYRMARFDSAMKILSKTERFRRLLYYFLKNERSKEIVFRLGTIKAYSILNLCVQRLILPNAELNRDLRLPEDVQKMMIEENVSDESDQDNDESEGSEDEDDSDEGDCSELADKNVPKKTENAKITPAEPLTDMYRFFVEYLSSVPEHENSKFNIYEGIIQLTNKKVIEQRVHRGVWMDRHAYPDSAMLQPELDENVLEPKINYFNVENLAHKLKCSKGMYENNFSRFVVYDLDELNQEYLRPTDIPHPSTFVPPKKNEKNRPKAGLLQFESRFESGNLRKATQTNSYEYELLVNPDTNTTKGLQWFYFQVSKVEYGIPYTFNIINFLKGNSQFNYGMQPIMFSVTEHTLNRTGWKRVGEEVIYYGNNYMDEKGSKQYRTLSFTVYFQHDNDYVYFAYHYPYTYTRLMTKLFPLLNYKSNEVYVRLDKLCTTVNTKNELVLLTITGAASRSDSIGIPFRKRPIIFITARVHSGETNASWIMEGVINFLLNETDENAIKAREHFIFKIIPMLNPEGVIYGNTRSGLTGADMNRCWANPNKITCPEIYNAKRVLACAKKELKLPLGAYIDIHGHSRKKYVFFYGCNPKMSWNKQDKASGDASEILKILPETVRSLNPNMRLCQCKYKIEKCRESTGRVVMWREFNVKHSYTLECSFSFGYNKQSVNTKILTDIGSSVVASLGKIADKAYWSRKSLSSFSLDYCCIDNYRTVDKRPITAASLREEHENRKILALSKSQSDCFEEPSITPLFINSRVLDKNY